MPGVPGEDDVARLVEQFLRPLDGVHAPGVGGGLVHHELAVCPGDQEPVAVRDRRVLADQRLHLGPGPPGVPTVQLHERPDQALGGVAVASAKDLAALPKRVVGQQLKLGRGEDLVASGEHDAQQRRACPRRGEQQRDPGHGPTPDAAAASRHRPLVEGAACPVEVALTGHLDRRRLGADPRRVEHAGERPGGGVVEERRHVEALGRPGTEAVDHLHGEQGVAARLEEVRGDADLLQAKDYPERLGHAGLGLGGRRLPCGIVGQRSLGEPDPVGLPARGQGDARDGDDGGRAARRGQDRGQVTG